MKIKYQDGRVIEAVAFSRTASTMRLAISGQDDVLELKRFNGAWITEDCEPVVLQEDAGRAAAVAEEDCLCPAGLAAHLIHLLYTDSSEDLEGGELREQDGAFGAPARLA